MIRLSLKYLFATLLLFIIEVVIALWVRDIIIRPYGGDTLVVILVYCFVRTFINSPILPTIIGTVVFAYLIEFLQYIHLINWLGLQDSLIARLVLGTGFSWTDMLAYTIGGILIYFFDKPQKTNQ